MKIGVLGTGLVGRAVAARLSELGNEVVVGTRDVAATMARTEPDQMGNPPYAEWSAAHPQVRLGTFADAAGHGALIVNATSGESSLTALTEAGAESLADKTIVDIANPLDFSQGFPPTLSVKDTDSLAEQLQRAFPRASVVKALNTLTAALMVDPGKLAGGDHTIFVCGDSAAAKAEVTELLRGFGWRDIIDLGDLSTARGTEMLLPIWLRLMTKLGTADFNFKIVR
jgi:predicted dinucleotide-binding enzyme